MSFNVVIFDETYRSKWFHLLSYSKTSSEPISLDTFDLAELEKNEIPFSRDYQDPDLGLQLRPNERIMSVAKFMDVLTFLTRVSPGSTSDTL